jgi:hypothetical protein
VPQVNWTALIIFVALFAFITWLGFAAARWRRGDLDLLHEWGLGGRRFGTIITWFLIGGDLYTAYTFIAVPALAFGAGAVAFFAVPYTIIAYPILFLFFPRLWYVCQRNLRGRTRSQAAAGHSRPEYHWRVWSVCNACAGIGSCAVSLPSFHYRHPERQ